VNEENLIKGIQSGNDEAFRQLIDTFQKQVFNTCNSIVHNTRDADDLTQDVFIEIFRSSKKYRGESRLSTWIYRIAVNKALNHIRGRKRKDWLNFFGVSETGTSKKEDLFSDGSLASDGMENRQRSQRLHQAIDSLAENQRTAFLLNKFEDLSYLQIAEIMSTSVPAVESLIHRAKINLQKKLYNEYKKNAI
jgi:RNA polymerase sigma-70 factor, ECF subfamily